MWRGAVFMLLTGLLSTVLGFLTGLGVGGGSLLVLYLTSVLGCEPEVARGVNLLFFLPGAAVSLILRRKQGQLQIRPLWPAMVAGCLSAALLSWVSQGLDTHILKKLFGVLLVFTGIRELFYRPK